MPSTPEQKEKWKQQREANKEQRNAYHRTYYQLNKEAELERTKQYREANPDKIKDYNKKALVKQSEQVLCDVCGCASTKHNLNRHKTSTACKSQTIL